jgi:probable glucitol transport protein GutA
MSSTTANRADRRTARLANPDRLPFGRLLAWAGAGLSAGANFIVLSYLTMYATDTLHLTPIAIGTVIAIGTLANAVFGFVAAWIVDRSPETRWGKARPYELAVPLLWLATGFLFSVPSSWGDAGKIGWIAAVFLVLKAIAAPLLGANDVLYMARAFPNRMVYAKVQTRAGIITALGAIAVSTSLPVLLNMAGKSPTGWSRVIMGYAFVLAILGLSRGIFVDEKFRAEAGEEQVKVRDMVDALKVNTWIWLLFGMLFFSQAVVGANVGSYYFRYIVGNLGIQGILAPIGIVLLPLLLVVPRLMRKYPVSQIILGGAISGVIGGIILMLAGTSIPLLIVGSLFTSIGALPISYLGVVMILDLATYNESLGKRRLESTLGAIVGIAGSIGAAVAAQAVGAIMSGTGYDGKLDQQGALATTAIRYMYGGAYVLGFAFIVFFMFLFMRFEKTVLPGAQAKVADLRQAKGLTATGAVDTNADGVVTADEVPLPPLTTSAQGMPTHADPTNATGPTRMAEDDPAR